MNHPPSNRPALVLGLFLISGAAFAAGSAPTIAPAAVVELWPEGRMPGIGAKEPQQDLPAKGDGVRRITNISRPTLTVFPSTRAGAPSPAMIICPGGGYSYVVQDKEGTEIAAWLNANGIAGLVLTYRAPKNREGALQDVQRALSLARARAVEWNLDPGRLGVIGFSAGGNLAAKACAPAEKRAYAALDAVDERGCRPDFAVLVYPAYLDDGKGHASPDLNLEADIPPTLIVHSEDDKGHVAGSKAYHAALERAKVAHVFKLYPTGGHGYGLRGTKDARLWPDDTLAWLRKTGIQPASSP